jgi:GNAT superfamily N-acetyltransferase
MPVISTFRNWVAIEASRATLFGRSRMKSVIFGYPVACPPPLVPPCAVAGEWVLANRANVRSLFAGDPERRERFSYFLDRGCTGLFFVRDGECLCHGWYSDPGSRLPGHMPPWCRRKGEYWVFSCRVHEASRRHGLYKELLRRIVASIRTRHPSARIHIDTNARNAPARRAIQACGFAQCGVIITYKIGIPSKWRTILGRWQPERPHPAQLALTPPTAGH